MQSAVTETNTAFTSVSASVSKSLETETETYTGSAGINATSYSESSLTNQANLQVSGNYEKRFETKTNLLSLSYNTVPELENDNLNPSETTANASVSTAQISDTINFFLSETRQLNTTLELSSQTYKNSTFNDKNSAILSAKYLQREEFSDHSYSVVLSQSDNRINRAKILRLVYGYSLDTSESSKWIFSILHSSVNQTRIKDTSNLGLSLDYNHNFNTNDSIKFVLESSVEVDEDGIARERKSAKLDYVMNPSEVSIHEINFLTKDSTVNAVHRLGYSYQYLIDRHSNFGVSAAAGSRKYSLGTAQFSDLSMTYGYRF